MSPGTVDRAVAAMFVAFVLLSACTDTFGAEPPRLLELEPGTWAVAADIQHGQRAGTAVASAILVFVKGDAGQVRFLATGCGQRGGQLHDDRGVAAVWLRGGTDRASKIAGALCAGHAGTPATGART